MTMTKRRMPMTMMHKSTKHKVPKMFDQEERENPDIKLDLFSEWTSGYILPVEKSWWTTIWNYKIIVKTTKEGALQKYRANTGEKVAHELAACLPRQLDAVEIVLEPLITQYPGRALWKISVLTKFALRNESAIGAKPSSVSHHSTHNVILIFTIKIIIINSKIRFSIRRSEEV